MDPRFDTSKDPRFRRAPRHVRKVEVDKRFAHMFEDKRFVETPTVDSRGRRMRRDTGRLKLREFYELADKSAPAAAEPSEASTARRKKAPKARARKAPAADEDEAEDDAEEPEVEEEPDAEDADAEDGAAAGSSEVEDSEDDDEEDEESEEEDGDGEADSSVWAAKQLDEDRAPRGDATKRVAIMGCDWDQTSASDLLVMLRTYLGGGESQKAGGALRSGTVTRVAVYPSDYGLEQMTKEAESGPQVLSESSGKSRKPMTQEEEEKAQAEALRRYQLQRTMYHWALAECDSAATACWLYDQLDGLEADGLSTRPLDLRFVPEDMEPPHTPTSEASEMPKRYKPPELHQTALGHSKVKCTWDEAPTQRKRDLMRKKFGPKEMADMDLQAYLASDSDEQENDSGAEALKKLARGAGSGSDDGGVAGSDSDFLDESDKEQFGDMEATFSVKAANLEEDLLERIKKQGGKAHTLEKKEEKSAWEKYLDKRKEKRRENRKKAQEQRKAAQQADEAEEEAPRTGKKDRKAKAGNDDDEEADAGDLALLADEEEGDKGFNLRMPQRRAHKGGSKQDGADGGFKVNVDDPRIAKIFTSTDFDIDPTKPEFRNSEGMRDILKKKRQKKTRRPTEEPANPRPAAAAAVAAAAAEAPAASTPKKAVSGGGLQLFAGKGAKRTAGDGVESARPDAEAEVAGGAKKKRKKAKA